MSSQQGQNFGGPSKKAVHVKVRVLLFYFYEFCFRRLAYDPKSYCDEEPPDMVIVFFSHHLDFSFPVGFYREVVLVGWGSASKFCAL